MDKMNDEEITTLDKDGERKAEVVRLYTNRGSGQYSMEWTAGFNAKQSLVSIVFLVSVTSSHVFFCFSHSFERTNR